MKTDLVLEDRYGVVQPHHAKFRLAAFSLVCSTISRISNVGRQPSLFRVRVPTTSCWSLTTLYVSSSLVYLLLLSLRGGNGLTRVWPNTAEERTLTPPGRSQTTLRRTTVSGNVLVLVHGDRASTWAPSTISLSSLFCCPSLRLWRYSDMFPLCERHL